MTTLIGKKIYHSVSNLLYNDEPDNIERIGSIYIPLTTVIIYLLAVKVVGPRLMNSYKPFKIKYLLIAFNVSIVSWNAYVSFNLLRIFFQLMWNGAACGFYKAPYLKEVDKRIMKYAWLFYLSKYVDLLDTIFFVLRKKQRQISFLHVFHHALVILLIWSGFHFKTRGIYIPLVMGLNSFVHVCTYTYYALTACGPAVQKLLHSKKIYLTFVQVAQFVIVLAFMIFGAVSGCDDLDYNGFCYICFFTILMLLFANFYKKNYKKD